jgi:hypothetical protein
MAEKLQTRSNHARFDPGFHAVLLGGLFLISIGAIVQLIRVPALLSVLFLLLTVMLIWAALKTRTYALKVQDRVIRLEERLRLSALAPPGFEARIGQLSESQLIALRFASDAEVATLAERALAEKLSNKQIKDAIRDWRPDYWRV